MKKMLIACLAAAFLCGSLTGCQHFLSFDHGETEQESQSEETPVETEKIPGDTEAPEVDPPETTPAESEPSEEDTQPEVPVESTPAASQPANSGAATGQPVTGATLSAVTYEGNYAGLSNEPIPFGYAKADRDEQNVPTGVHYYKNLYGKYGADFIQDTSKKIIYITLDEGYEAGYTAQILDVFKEKNVRATFFITKQYFDSSPELIQRMIDEGHVIGNHTCAHPSGGMPQLGAEGIRADVQKLHDMVKERFGYEMKLFRFPEGTFSEQALAVINDMGYHSVFWSFAHADWDLNNQPDPTASLNEVLAQIHPGAVYLLHAVSATNTQIMGDFIDGARALGYEFGVYPTNY